MFFSGVHFNSQAIAPTIEQIDQSFGATHPGGEPSPFDSSGSLAAHRDKSGKWYHPHHNLLKPSSYSTWGLVLKCKAKFLPLVFSLVGQFRNEIQGSVASHYSLPGWFVFATSAMPFPSHSYSVQLC